MIVRNETEKPIRVPLGKGKVLHLGPGKSGSVLRPATERPAFVRMVERGDISVRSESDAPSDEGRGGADADGQQPSSIQRKGLAGL